MLIIKNIFKKIKLKRIEEIRANILINISNILAKDLDMKELIIDAYENENYYNFYLKNIRT